RTSEVDAKILATDAVLLHHALNSNEISGDNLLLVRRYLTALNRVRGEDRQADDVLLLLSICAQDLQGIINRGTLFSLPVEVLGRIFVYAMDSFKSHRHILRQPRILRQVCKAWNNVAIGLPALWSTLPIALTHTVVDLSTLGAFEKQLTLGYSRDVGVKLALLPLRGPSIPLLASRPNFIQKWTSIPAKWLARRPELVRRISYIEVNLVELVPLLVAVLRLETPRLRTVILPGIDEHANILAPCFPARFGNLSHLEIGSFPPRLWTAGDTLVYLAVFISNATAGYCGQGDARVLETAVRLETLVISDLRGSQGLSPAGVARVRLAALSRLHLRIESGVGADSWLSKFETSALSELVIAHQDMSTTQTLDRPIYQWPSEAGKAFLRTCNPHLLTSLSVVNIKIDPGLAPFLNGRAFHTLILLPPSPFTIPARVLEKVLAIGRPLCRLGLA
ncbi:hypothetical protein CYLTODRAFT_460581, partial [Cylindrobasidium torrendii FP15055 ss-10]